MFAVMKAGGKQYKVKEGSFVSVAKMALDKGAQLEINEVLLLDNNGKVKVGSPFVDGASVTATVMDHKKHKTVYIFKKSRRKNYRRKNGHRQVSTILRIDGIKG